MRRDIVALRDLGIPVEGERGRGGSYRLKPGFRVPPLMFTSGEAAAVALGLLAARRLGLEAESALGKVRRVLPERLRRGVESLEQMLGFTGERARPRRPTARRCSRWPTRRAAAARVGGHLHRLGGRRRRRASSARTASSRTAAAGTSRRSTTSAASSGCSARTGWHVALGAAGEPAPDGFDATAFVSRGLARVPWAHEVEVVLACSLDEAAQRFPPTLAELEERTAGAAAAGRFVGLGRGVAGRGGVFVPVVAPEELRGAVRALARGCSRRGDAAGTRASRARRCSRRGADRPGRGALVRVSRGAGAAAGAGARRSRGVSAEARVRVMPPVRARGAAARAPGRARCECSRL